MLLRVRVARWSSRLRKLWAGSPLVVLPVEALVSAALERRAGVEGLVGAGGCSSV